MNDERNELIKEAIKRICSKSDKDYWEKFLKEIVNNNVIPEELLQHVPIKSALIKKTRFDQLYDACMELAFPDYDPENIKKLVSDVSNSKIKIWRVVFPEKFGITNVLIRAESYQQAFALACDYGCRVSLRMFKKIPSDLTIRVMFLSDQAIRRYLKIRWSNRTNKRKKMQMEARTFTDKQIYGARLAAMGHPQSDMYSIVKYSEMKDLRRIRENFSSQRDTKVESETYKKDSPPLTKEDL